MSAKLLDLTGQVFDRLTILARVPAPARITSINGIKKSPWWSWRCQCGNTGESRSRELRKSHVKSCGCLNDEKRAERAAAARAARRITQAQYRANAVLDQNIALAKLEALAAKPFRLKPEEIDKWLSD